MALFNRNPFKRIEKSQHIQSSLVPQSFTQYDSEYIEYCIAQEQSVSNLETGLHTTDDPKEIAMQTLRTACDFYAADWAGIVELDLELGVASPGWWYNPDPKVTSIQKMYEQEDFFSMKTWISSFKHGNPIVISDISEIIKRSPQEYQVYKRLNVRSIMAVPFSSTPNGFLVIRNPSRYNNRTSTLIALAYILHRAMTQKNYIERTRMVLPPEEIKSDKDVTNDDSLRKMLYLASQNIVNHWTVVCRNWDMVSNQLRILFEGRETV